MERQKVKYSSRREGHIARLREKLAVASTLEGVTADLDIKNPNRTERAFAVAARGDGWGVTKRGWPDYLCWKGDELICVEVKKEGLPLSPYQKMVMGKLSKVGIRCFRWSPLTGFTKYEGGAL